MKLRFEEKAKIRQQMLQAITQTRQTAWMFVAWLREYKQELIRNHMDLVECKINNTEVKL